MNTLLIFIKKRKLYLLIIFALIALFVARTVLLQTPNTNLTYTVAQEDLVDTIQVSGTYKTASQVPVMSLANGIITELFVGNGDEVKKGDPLFHIESTATVDQEQKAYADYKSALNALTTAQNTKQSLDAAMWTKKQAFLTAQNNQNYKNENTTNPSTKEDYTELEKEQIDSSVVQTQKDFIAAEQAYQTIDTSISAAKAQVAQAREAYARTQSVTINASTFGIISNLQDKIGDQVAVTQPVLVIANLSGQHISSSISEDYAARIRSGQKTIIVFDALKEKSFSGVVSGIDTLGTTDAQGIVTYEARITVDSLPSVIKPGMTALVTIETLHKDNVITVPNSAIIHRNGKDYVKLANTKKNNLIEVKLGVRGMTKTEVTNGVGKGTIILADPDGT